MARPADGRALQQGPAANGEMPYLLTVSDVAAFLRTSRVAVYAMAERGQLPGLVRIGRRILVRRDDLLEWVRESRTPSPRKDRR